MSQPLPKKVREWTGRFERFHRSQVTLSQFWRDEGVSMQSFYQWRKPQQKQRAVLVHVELTIRGFIAISPNAM